MLRKFALSLVPFNLASIRFLGQLILQVNLWMAVSVSSVLVWYKGYGKGRQYLPRKFIYAEVYANTPSHQIDTP